MLTELRVRDLAVIADVTLPFEPGLNVLTGETGAGKSMVVDALSLLLGERASADIVRPGSDKTIVEGAFEFASAVHRHLLAPFAALGIEQLLPFADRRIEAQQVAEDPLRLGKAGRVHRLFQVARQTTQLIGVRQALRLYF